jgi:hypothetical protein
MYPKRKTAYNLSAQAVPSTCIIQPCTLRHFNIHKFSSMTKNKSSHRESPTQTLHKPTNIQASPGRGCGAFATRNIPSNATILPFSHSSYTLLFLSSVPHLRISSYTANCSLNPKLGSHTGRPSHSWSMQRRPQTREISVAVVPRERFPPRARVHALIQFQPPLEQKHAPHILCPGTASGGREAA